MGREIRRVPFDFSWPLNKIWEGFQNPHYQPCPEDGRTCFGGSSAAGQWIEALCRFIELLGKDAAAAPNADGLRASGRIYPHPYIAGFPQAPIGVPLDAGLARFVAGLAGVPALDPNPLFGRQVVWEIEERLLLLAGLDAKHMQCPTCHGEGIDPASLDAYNKWERTDPPTGEGWQVWETVSEGSPISPVFKTAAGLVQHLVNNGTTREAAEAFCVDGGSVPSFVTEGGKIYDDIEAATLKKGG